VISIDKLVGNLFCLNNNVDCGTFNLKLPRFVVLIPPPTVFNNSILESINESPPTPKTLTLFSILCSPKVTMW